MVNPIDFGGHSSNVKVTMEIIDKLGVRGDATLCVVIFIVCCESVGNCQTLSKDGPSQLLNNIIFRPFFFPLRPMSIVSYQFCPVPTCSHHVFCTLFSCLSIDSSLYHEIFSDM